MNYAIVAIGGVVLIVALCWVAWGRRHFHGPVSTLVEEAEEGDRKVE